MIKTELYARLLNYDFESLFNKKGYKYFTRGNYNLNIIGVRSSNGNKVTNKYDDFLVVIYNANNKTKRVIYSITTEPGKHYMLTPMNSKGAAILVPGQYCGTWQIDRHRGKYKALCQKKPVKVYRDNNKNLVYDLDPTKVDKGIFGINIHRSNEFYTRQTVDQYSAGCQVFNDPAQFASFMTLCEKQKALYGNSFTYTLINEKDLV
jgi:hypothetical protein